MKKSFSFLFAAGLFFMAGCGFIGTDYDSKARELVCKNVDYLVNLNDGKHDLYTFSPASNYSLSINKVDLKTEQSQQVQVYIPRLVENFRIKNVFVPEDKGHDNPNPQFSVYGSVVAPVYGEAVVLYDAKTEKQTLICQGDDIYLAGDLILCAQDDSFGSGYTSADVFNMQGQRPEYRSFNGSIAGNDVVANLVINEKGDVVGSYYYTKFVKNNRPKSFLGIVGQVSQGNRIKLSCYNAYGNVTEIWEGTLINGVIQGVMTLEKNDRRFDFALYETMN